MRVLEILRLRLRTLLTRGRLDREVEEELRFHLDRQTQQNLDAGMPPDRARQAAIDTIGGAARIQEQCREARGFLSFAGLGSDLGRGWRVFGREPAFAAAVVATLALGIGVNTAVFRIADTLLLRGLPVQEPQRLFQVLQPDGRGLHEYGELFAAGDYAEFRNAAARFAQLAAETDSREVQAALDGSSAEPVRHTSVSPDYFQALGVEPALGRVFEPAGDNSAVILSYGFWTRRLARDPRILGRSLRIDNSVYVVAGVAEQAFSGIETGAFTDAWTKLDSQPPHSRSLRLIGRLLPGATIEQAFGPMQAILHQHMRDMVGRVPPGTPRSLIDRILQLQLHLVSAANGISPLRAGNAAPLWIVFGLVALILLLACATVATLFEARRSARRREMAVRISLGAGRWRLLRQLLCEGLPLAGAAALAGLVLAYWTAPVLANRLSPAGLTIQLPGGIDLRVLAFTAELSLVTALLFGIVPAWHSSRVAPWSALASGRPRSAGGRPRSAGGARSGKILVAVQVALSTMLVTGATLFVRTLVNLSTLDPGFESRNTLVADVQFRGADRTQRLALAWGDLLRRVASLPGVESASLASGGAFNGAFGNGMLRLPGAPVDTRNAGCVFFSASPGFFATSGIPLLAGRDFAPPDFDPAAPPVALISESLAREFFQTDHPVGRTFSNLEDKPPRWITVIGAVGDTRFENLRDRPPRVVYLPYTWPRPSSNLSVVLRARRDTGALTSALRREAAAASPDFTLRHLTSETELIDRTLARERLLAAVASFFGALALLMAAVGLYGIMTFTVAQRTGEIGVRMALGAARGTVLRMILRESALVVLIGAAVGLPVSWVAGHVLSTLLYGAKVTDAATIATSLTFVLAGTVAAALIPARRAARIDPIAALRYE
jgi:predicted permease